MGDIVIDVDKIPDIMFTDAVQKYDISLVEILSTKERKYGEPDVIVHQLDGSEIRITRSELVNNYRYLNNQRIRLYRWKNRHKVALFRNVDKSVAVLYIRDNMSIDYGDKTDSMIPEDGEYYIVCDVVDGNLDREHYSLVKRELFNKAYVITTTLDTDIVRSELGIGKYRNTDDEQDDGRFSGEEEDGYVGYDFEDEDEEDGGSTDALDAILNSLGDEDERAGFRNSDGDGYVGYDFDDEDDDGGTDALDAILNSLGDGNESDRFRGRDGYERDGYDLDNGDNCYEKDEYEQEGYSDEVDDTAHHKVNIGAGSRQGSGLRAGSRAKDNIDKAKYIRDIASESERMFKNDTKTVSKDNTDIMYKALGRLINGGKVIGFKVTDGKRVIVMSNKDVMILAQRNGIDNIGVKVVDGKPVLYGIGIKISDLDGIKLGN